MTAPDPAEILRAKHRELEEARLAPVRKKLDACLESADRAVSEMKPASRSFKLPRNVSNTPKPR